MRHQSPPQGVRAPLPGLWMSTHHKTGLGGCHVPIRRGIRDVAQRGEGAAEQLWRKLGRERPHMKASAGASLPSKLPEGPGGTFGP